MLLRQKPHPTRHRLLISSLSTCRRHISLLRSLVPDGTSSIIPVHTILEVYRVSDMSLVRVLPSAEDEVNAAAFHPHPVRHSVPDISYMINVVNQVCLACAR